MSVEYCVVRVPPETFQEIQRQPSILQDLMDEYDTLTSERVHFDSREVFHGKGMRAPAILRMVYFDEFTTALLVNFMDEGSAFFVALAGWGVAHILNGVSYGYGEISYYAPEEVKRVSLELHTYPQTLLADRFMEAVDDFRIASAGYFEDDQEIIAHQQRCADLLRRFCNEAAQDGDYVLLLTV
jgi:hypothetical protein